MFDFLKAKPRAEGASSTPAEQASEAAGPQPAAAGDASPADGKYTVQPGDSLAKIANRYNVPLAQLIAANPQVENPDLIHPREVINLG